MKKSIALLAPLLLAACQNQPHYTVHTPPPPPPQSVPQHPYSPPPPPPHARPVPSYAGTAGPLAAANAGHYMDGMEHDLRRILRGVPVARPGDTLVLNLRSDALFERGSLSSDGRDILKDLAVALRHYDHTLIQINGYTDTRLAQDQGLKASQKTADAVAAELRTDGVEARRITATGLGATHLKIATGDGMNEPRNRRVEIRIAPHPG